ncbi:MAG: hypothetical protein R3F60_19415 [bacterium]
MHEAAGVQRRQAGGRLGHDGDGDAGRQRAALQEGLEGLGGRDGGHDRRPAQVVHQLHGLQVVVLDGRDGARGLHEAVHGPGAGCARSR